MDDVIKVALAQQECALERAGERLVLMLDGRAVRVHRGPERSEDRRVSESEARDAFVSAIERAMADGFVPMRRDPPQTAVTPVRRDPPPPPPPVRAPAPERPRAPPKKAIWSDLGLPIEGDAVQVELGGMVDVDWEELAGLDGVHHLEIFVLSDAEYGFGRVAELGLPPWATGLTLASFEGIEEFDESVLDVGRVAAWLGRLQRLELRAGTIRLPPLALAELEHLEIWCSRADPELVASIAAAAWPRVRTARFWLGGLAPSAALPILDPTRWPALADLRIEGTSDDDALAGAMKDSPLAARLATAVAGDDVLHGDPDLFPPADGIELLSTGEFFPLRSSRFQGI